MSSADRLGRVLAAAAAADGTPDAPMPARLCHAVVGLVAVTGATVSLLSEGRYGATLCATDALAAHLDALHLTLGEGPGLDAHEGRRPVHEPDLAGASPDRWPAFTEAALAVGARAVFAFPMRIGAIGVGVLGLYRDTPGPLSAIGVGDAVVVASLTAQSVLALAAQDPPGGFDDVVDGVALRSEVHQATGMVAVQLGVSVDEAFVRMQARAYAEGRVIGDVAADVVSRLLRFQTAAE